MWMVGAHYRKPVAYSRGGARGRRRARSRACATWSAGSTPDAPGLDEFARALLRRAGGRLQHAAGPRGAVRVGRRGQPPHGRGRAPSGPGGSARCSTRSASRRCSRSRTRRPRSSSGSPPSARRRAPRATSSAPTGSATSSPSAGWEIRDTPEGARLVRAVVIVYGRNAGAGGAARQAPGAARVRERAGRPGGLAGRRRDRDRGAVGARGALRLAGPPGPVRRGRARTRTWTPTRCSSRRTRWCSPWTRSRTRTTSARSRAWPRAPAAPASCCPSGARPR